MSKIWCLCYWNKIVYWCQWVRIWIINGRCLYLVLYAKLLSLWMNSRFGQNDKLSFYFSCFYVWHQMLKVFIVFVIFSATLLHYSYRPGVAYDCACAATLIYFKIVSVRWSSIISQDNKRRHMMHICYTYTPIFFGLLSRRCNMHVYFCTR